MNLVQLFIRRRIATILLALDVSGSMATGQVAGTSLPPREASAALALLTAATEANTHIVGFAGAMVPLPLSPTMRQDDAVRAVAPDVILSAGYDGTFSGSVQNNAIRAGLSLAL